MRNVWLLFLWLILSAMALQALAGERLHALVDGDTGPLPDRLARAERGTADFQYLTGYRLLVGETTTRDARLAARWLRRAAAQGHTQARRELRELRRRMGEFRRRYPLPDMRRVRRNLVG